MKFTKMHGCGNDYIYFDCTKEEFPGGAEGEKQAAIKLSDRHFGIGGDGIEGGRRRRSFRPKPPSDPDKSCCGAKEFVIDSLCNGENDGARKVVVTWKKA